MKRSVIRRLFAALLAIALVFTFTVPVSAVGAPEESYIPTQEVEKQAPEPRPIDISEPSTEPPSEPTELTEVAAAESVTKETTVVRPTEAVPVEETEIIENEVNEPIESPEAPSEKTITEEPIKEITSEEPVNKESTLADTETEEITTEETTVVEPVEVLPVDETEITENEVNEPVETPETPLEETITEEPIEETTSEELVAETEETPVETALEQEEIVYNTSSLTLDNLPEYIVNNTLEKDVTAVGLAEDDMHELSSFTTINEDETRTLYLFNDPVKYIDKTDNSIKFIDNSIVPVTSENGGLLAPTITGYKNGGNSYDLLMPSRINMGVRFTSDDVSVIMTPAVASTAQGNLKSHSFLGITEQVVEYQNVFGSGIHLQYTPVNSGVKENIILDSYTGVNTFSFSLSTGDYYPLYTEGEAIPFIDPATDDTAFILGQVDARDSYTGEETDGHFTLYNSLSLTEIRPGLYTLTVTVDEEFLSDPDTVYPVVIDPTVSLVKTNMFDTSVYSGQPTTQTYYSSAYTIVGNHGTTYGEGIGFIRCTSKIREYFYIGASNITSAKYKIYEASGKTNSMTVQLRGALSNWNQGSITYANQPSLGTVTSSVTISKSGWYEFTTTPLVKEWIKEARGEGGYSFMRGFALKASATGISSKHFCSANYNGTLTPSLVITFNTPPVYYINAVYNSNPLKAWGKLYVNEIPPLIKFYVNTAGVYVFETMNSSYLTNFNFSASNTKLVLYNTSFSILAQNDDISSTNKFSRIETTLQTGTYYLTIINQDPSTTAVNCYLILERFNASENPANISHGELTNHYSIYDYMREFYKIGDSDSSNCMQYVLNTDEQNLGALAYSKAIEVMTRYHYQERGINDPDLDIDNCIVSYGTSNYINHSAKIENGVVTAKLNGDMEYAMHTNYNCYTGTDHAVIRFFMYVG